AGGKGEMKDLPSLGKEDGRGVGCPGGRAAGGGQRLQAGDVGKGGGNVDGGGGGAGIAERQVEVAGLRGVDRVFQVFAVGHGGDGIAAARVGVGNEVDIVRAVLAALVAGGGVEVSE